MRPGDIVVVHRTSFDVCDMSPLTSNETPARDCESYARLVIANRTHAYVDLTGYRVLVTRDRVRSAPSSVQQKSAKKAGAR